MAPSHALPSSTATRKARLSRLILGLVYFSALCALILWESRERFDLLSSPCDLAETAPKSSLYAEPYRYFLDWASHDAPNHVNIISIPVELEEIQGNLCHARAYMADLLRSVATQHPSEVVIDKFYSPSSCVSDPGSTRELQTVIQSLPFPVIIGESTNVASSPIQHSCLLCKPQLDFASPNVHHGLTRLNADPEKVPLEWTVLPIASDNNQKPRQLDSLAWAAVKLYDPAYAARPRIQALVNSERHPYANLDNELPHQTSTQLLCSAGTADMQHRWSATCPGALQTPNLLGKIVLIGAENPVDRQKVLGTTLWGLDLQARYIDTLLSSSFLYELPFAATFFIFALYVFLIEGLPTLLIAFRPRWKKKWFICHAYPRRRFFWVGFWTIAFVLICSFVSLLLRYLPPLAVLGDIAFVAVTRLLLFAAEASEHPFVHGKKKGAH